MYGYVKAERYLEDSIEANRGRVSWDVVAHAQSVLRWSRCEHDRIVSGKDQYAKQRIEMLSNRLIFLMGVIDGCASVRTQREITRQAALGRTELGTAL